MLERLRLSRGGPDLELDVAGALDLQHGVLPLVDECKPGHALRVAAIEALREPQHGRQRLDDPLLRSREVGVSIVALFRCGASMIPGDERDDVDFLRLEAAQIAVPDQVERVLVVGLVADVHADVVQKRGVLQPLALAVRQAVRAPRRVEEPAAQASDLCRMRGRIVAAFGELDHAAAPDVGIAVGLLDALSMASDVIEHEPFTE